MANTNRYIGLKAVGMGFDAHLTVHYVGEITPHQEDYLKLLLRRWGGARTFTVTRGTITNFRTSERPVPVVTVGHPVGLSLLQEFLSKNFKGPSEWPWNPHISLHKAPVDCTITIPPRISLNKLDLY